MSENLQAIFENAKAYCASLGDDVYTRERKEETLFFSGGGTRFANLALRPKDPRAKDHLRVYVNLNVNTFQEETYAGFVQIMARGPRIKIYTNEDWKRAEPLLQMAYDAAVSGNQKAAPPINQEAHQDTSNPIYEEWQAYIQSLGRDVEENTYPEVGRALEHQKFTRLAGNGDRVGFAAVEHNKNPIRIWARLNYAKPYEEAAQSNAGWTFVDANADTRELEWMKADLSLAYIRSYESKHD